MRERKTIAWMLILPAWVWLGLFFVLPMLLMVALSFRPDMHGGVLRLDWTPTVAHYTSIIQGGSYLRLLWASVRVALLVAGLSTLLAYPLAYFLAFRAGNRAPLLLTLAILPFWVSYLLRVIALKTILGSNGFVNNLLIHLGLVNEPVPILLYSRTAVILTLVYVWACFVTLPIYVGLRRVSPSLLEAAAINGAPPWSAFLRVTLPMSMPGVIAGFFMVFIPTVGEYITPLLVGGSRGKLYGNIIELFFGDGLNWPLGSALAVIMLLGVLILVLALARLVDLRRFSQ